MKNSQNLLENISSAKVSITSFELVQYYYFDGIRLIV